MAKPKKPLSEDDHIIRLNELDDREQDLKDRIHELLQSRCQLDPATGCCIFTGAWEESGQAKMRVGRRIYGVNRIAAWLYLPGYELWDETVVGRTCGVPACFNEEHLVILPNQAAALAFQAQHGRLGAHHRKLTLVKARFIRALDALGVPHPEIARQLQVRLPAVRAVLAGKTWPEPETP